MYRSICWKLSGAACFLVLALNCSATYAQPETKDPVWVYAFDLSCRKFGEADFTKDTKKFGFEVFKDMNNGYGVYVNQTGDIGTAPSLGVTPPITDAKAPKWTVGLDLKARKAGEIEFTEKTKTYGLEVFYDNVSKHWVYVTQEGRFAVASGRAPKDGMNKAPVWLHSVDLKVRKGGNESWAKDNTIDYGIEVYYDPNGGNLVYVCENSAISVVPVSGTPKSSEKSPSWLHGQDLKCRKANEPEFTPKTQVIGVEIFRDNNNDNLIVLSENGSITVVPEAGKGFEAPTKEPKDASFNHGLNLQCRQAGELNFTDKTRTFGIEVFDEVNLGLRLYVSQDGNITAAPKS
ncbi:MAG: hypothetical protein ACFCD0_26325 [Gemmataceae bacterium]